eukprot:6462362-Pyramimonas_sp.AAC.1
MRRLVYTRYADKFDSPANLNLWPSDPAARLLEGTCEGAEGGRRTGGQRRQTVCQTGVFGRLHRADDPRPGATIRDWRSRADIPDALVSIGGRVVRIPMMAVAVPPACYCSRPDPLSG